MVDRASNSSACITTPYRAPLLMASDGPRRPKPADVTPAARSNSINAAILFLSARSLRSALRRSASLARSARRLYDGRFSECGVCLGRFRHDHERWQQDQADVEEQLG
jgi:hypothetical protein